ncbi:hypothetical protein Scep_001192 [Stephania cephalantha]|uniref:Uncharacterized protein n=1 Tax=Stephania cephalantha TaxID=152367 RepID=A0AAP0Q7H1_9MAGN
MKCLMKCLIGSPSDDGIFVTIVHGLARAGLNNRAGLNRETLKFIDLVCRFQEDPSLKIFNSVLDVLFAEDTDLTRKFYVK